MRQSTVEPSGLQVRGLTQSLASVVTELKTSIHGADLLVNLLNAPRLQPLLTVYEILQQHLMTTPAPRLQCSSGLSQLVIADLHGLVAPSPEAKELRSLLSDPHLQALLSSLDTVAQKDYAPGLPPLPDNLPTDEEAVRIVRMIRNNQPLGATIKRDEVTGKIFVARVILGGLADQSGLLNVGDRLVEVNQEPVEGKEPEEIIQILARCQGTVMFKVVPHSNRPASHQPTLFVQAMVDYSPRQDPVIPCVDAGMQFCRGDVLEIVDQTDPLWWQARKLPATSGCAGLVPSTGQLRRKQRELSQLKSFQALNWLDTLSFGDDEAIDEKCVETDEEVFESEELRGDDSDFSTNAEGLHIAGFRRSLRLCRRKAHNSYQQSCPPLSFRSIPSAPTNPYLEVVQYRRLLQDRHRLIALVGPCGVGVNELRRRLIKTQPKIIRAPVPHTTRPPNSSEEHGREYHFISTNLFEKMMDNQRFLEYGNYKGHLYGTSFDAIADVLDEGMICVIDVDPSAVPLVRTPEFRGYVVFVKPPSAVRLRQTRKKAWIVTSYYVNRPFEEEDFQEMEEMGRKMEAQYGHLFDYVLVNDRLPDACVELLAVTWQAQNEPQWVPAYWLSSSAQS